MLPSQTWKIRLRRSLAGFLLTSAAILPASCTSRAPAPPAADVWAVVDGREIRREDVERVYRRTVAPSPAPSGDEALIARLRILDELIDQDILLARARTHKVDVTDAEVEKAFAARKSNMTEDAFQKELGERSLTAEDMKTGLRRELIIRKLLEQEVGSKLAIPDEAVREFYDRNRQQFNVPETRYRLAQIVVTPVRDPETRNRANDDAASPAEAQRKARMLMERLKGGADFAALAMDFSEDTQTAHQGGDLGIVPASALNQVSPQLRQAVLNASPGQVTLVSAGGAHTIVLVAGKEAAGQRDLGSAGVRETITELLRARREELFSGAYVAAARDEVKIVNHLARQIVESGGNVPGLLSVPAGGR